MVKTSSMVYKTLVVSVIILFLGMSIVQSVTIDDINKTTMPIISGNTLYVGGTGEGNYTKIQDAIDDASSGDTVFVYDDSSPYWEFHIYVNKSIFLIGEDRDTTIIAGELNISANWVNISGFNIQYQSILVNSNYNTINGNIIQYSHIGIKICSNYNIISENNINWVDIGIEINSNYNIISDNTISNSYYGIYLSNSIIGNSILRNNISYNEEYAIWLDSADRNTIKDNIISLNELYGIRLEDSYNNSISNNNISWTQFGVEVSSSNHNSIISNNFVNNTHDLGLYKSFNNTIKDNIFIDTHCCRSIRLRDSSYNYIFNNILLNGGFSGIEFSDNSNFNIINNNQITTGWEGIRIWINSSYNLITNNIIYNNEWGVYINEFSNNNSIYHNEFINNSEKAYDECNNSWDYGYPAGGNFWDDYNGTDADGDGIGDTPYPIPGGNNIDRYPLGNLRPNKPIIDGPSQANPETEVCFTFHSTDAEDNEVKYIIDWGDGTIFETDYYPSCEPLELCHTWAEKVVYIIKAKAIDIWGAESDWSEFRLEINRNKASYLWYQWFLNRFPLLERLLNLIR